MPIILLVRHGENEFVKKGRLAGRLVGVHLNQNGCEQAKALAGLLADVPIKALYSSPLERALETATPLADKLGLEILPRDGLIEVDIGEWQGKTVKGLSRLKLWRTVQNAPSRMHFPGGETFAEAQFRICSELEVLASMHQDGDVIVCVSHSDPIKLAVAFYLGLPIDLFQRLHISPASITSLIFSQSGCRLLNINYEISFSLPKS
jgi:probable phosphoglycerate mutase